MKSLFGNAHLHPKTAIPGREREAHSGVLPPSRSSDRPHLLGTSVPQVILLKCEPVVPVNELAVSWCFTVTSCAGPQPGFPL